MLVLVAPGQGAQKPGFLTPWLDLPGVTERLTWWSAVTGLDLVSHGSHADEARIRDTAVAQPLLVAAGLVTSHALLDADDGRTTAVDLVAGHSVGELVAATRAGVLTPEAALVLVRHRGQAMARAAAASETGMSAVLGGDRDEVLSHLDKLSLTPANVNGAGQIVAAGATDALAELAADRPSGARVRPLSVAGAFHTSHMAPAVTALETLVPGIGVNDPHTPYVSNLDGRVVDSGGDVVKRLVTQVSSPVRWDLCMETFQRLGVTAMIELAPGGTLTGIAKRAMRGVRTVALKTPADLDQARSLIAEYAGPASDGPIADAPAE